MTGHSGRQECRAGQEVLVIVSHRPGDEVGHRGKGRPMGTPVVGHVLHVGRDEDRRRRDALIQLRVQVHVLVHARRVGRGAAPTSG